MIKATVGNLIILGLSKENIARLKQGKPILFDATNLGLPGKHIAIHYGETEQALMDELIHVISTPRDDEKPT